MKLSTSEIIAMDNINGAHNDHPIPVEGGNKGIVGTPEMRYVK
jgi:hypothetical protein